MTTEERFWSRVDASGDCWLWTSTTNNAGYGTFTPHRGNQRMAHRFAYELLVGPIPDRFHVDHLCRVKTCLNPDHLEAVSALENNRRAPTTHAGRSHCKHGHPFDATNTLLKYRPDGLVRQRVCRACRKVERLKSRARRAAEARS